MEKEKVSIVLPIYNGERHMRQSIESCLGQSHKNIELIIVDDGSTDKSLEITSSYKDSRIKRVRHETNKGLPAALNAGFEKATGEYLTWTSDDNYYAESAVEDMVSFLKEKKGDFVYCDFYRFGDEDPENRMLVNSTPISTMEKENCVGACFLYSKKVRQAVGNYNQEKELAEDYDYWARVSKKFPMLHLAKPLYFYREHKTSLSREKPTEAAIAGALVRLENKNSDIGSSVNTIVEAAARRKPKKTKIRIAVARVLFSRKIKKVLEDFRSEKIGFQDAKTALEKIVGKR